MQILQQSYRSLSLVMQLNWDRFQFLLTIVLALLAGAYLGSL